MKGKEGGGRSSFLLIRTYGQQEDLPRCRQTKDVNLTYTL